MIRKQRGQGIVEYALILVLIAIVAIGIITIVQNPVNTRCQDGFFYSYRVGGCVSGYDPDYQPSPTPLNGD